MSRSDVVERNVEALLRAAYEPARARLEFRERMRRELHARVARPKPRSIVLPLALAAAALAAIGYALFGLGWDRRGAVETPPIAKDVAPPNARDLAPEAPDVAQPATPREGSSPRVAQRDGPSPGGAAPDGALGVALLGRVHDAADDAPIASFRVTLIRIEEMPSGIEPTRHDVTNADGEFEISGVAAGSYRVHVQAGGYSGWRKASIDLGGASVPVLDVPLRRGAPIRGRVVEAGSGEPIAGVLVLSETDTPAWLLKTAIAEKEPWMTAADVTDASGAFEIEHASEGTQKLRASDAVHAPAWSKLEHGATPSGDVVLRMTRGGVVEGRVTGKGGTPAVHVPIIAACQDPERMQPCLTYGITYTDADGRYQVSGVAPGAYTVLRLEPPVAYRFTQVDEGVAARVDFLEGPSGTRVHGKVVGVDGRFVTGYTVTVVPKNVPRAQAMAKQKAVILDPDGGFELNDLAADTYQAFLARGMGDAVYPMGEIDVPPLTELEHTFRITFGTIGAAVTSAATGQPIAKVRLVVLTAEGDGFQGFVMTGPDGRATLPLLPAGKYRVVAAPSSPGIGVRIVELAVAEDGTAPPLAIAMGPGIDVRVSVRDAAGAPVSGAHVEFRDEAGQVWNFEMDSRTDREGRFVAHAVPAGKWRVVVLGEGGAEASKELEVATRIDSSIEIVFPKR
ncbi:MAG TPA: carboxypeptidase regulatory-like domain-containing protein [Planctomycetota bacterium]|nr:carboxypeptidase regulatory-like domain-containing protein [Planctomycetota bacterium]